MNMNKKGFTLIELLAVIVVLAIVTVIATRSVLPFMANARPDAFKIEATNVVKSAQDAISLYNLGQVKLKNNEASCKKNKVVCFTIGELIDLHLYEGDKDIYKGSVLIDITDNTKPTYTLYLQKGAEFNINGGTETDYVNNGDSVAEGAIADIDTRNVCDC